MRDSYHHGDLHAALLAAGREQLATDGLEKLSLRAVARAAGVSPAAPYRHFKDKHHLLVAIATEGFLILAEMMREATRRQSHDLDAVGQAYLAFAQRNPEVYRLMFTRPMHHETQASDPALLEASAKTFGVLEDVIATGSPPDTSVPPTPVKLPWRHGLWCMARPCFTLTAYWPAALGRKSPHRTCWPAANGFCAMAGFLPFEHTPDDRRTPFSPSDHGARWSLGRMTIAADHIFHDAKGGGLLCCRLIAGRTG